MTINVATDSTVTGPNDKAVSCGICVNGGSLTIKGSGTLYATGGTATTGSCGVDAGGLTVNGTLYAEGGEAGTTQAVFGTLNPVDGVTLQYRNNTTDNWQNLSNTPTTSNARYIRTKPPVATVSGSGATATFTDLSNAVTAWNATTGGTLKLLDDVETADTITVSTGTKTLDLNGFGIRYKESSNKSVITVSSNAYLTMQDTVDDESTKPIHKITLNSSGRATEVETVNAAGKDSSDTVFVTGGYITGGTGTDSNGGGGVLVYAGGTFTMTGGTIIGNTADSDGGGVYVDDGGLFNLSGDAKITGNTVTDGSGGGVNNNGTFTMTGGTIIGNTASDGGGVYVNDGGLFNLSGNAKITDNTTSNYGGGVYVANGGSFTMTGGSITKNTTSNYGGGVYVDRGGRFTMEGGSITDNTADNGGGVLNGGTFNLSGSPTIKNNKKGSTTASNVYLPDGTKITVNGALTDDASIGVTMGTPGVFTATGTNLSGSPSDYKAKFFSDSADYTVKAATGDDAGQLMLADAPVEYREATYTDTLSWSTATATDYVKVESSTTEWANDKTYVVKSDVTITGRIGVTGTVNLILCDGATLNANVGITVATGTTLNIYAQSAGTGALSADASSRSCEAGIGGDSGHGGGTVNIHGGNVTIYGGTVTATGGDKGAGIGMGCEGTNHGDLNVYNGLKVLGGDSENPTTPQTDYANTRSRYMVVFAPVASVTSGSTTSYYSVFNEAVTAWNTDGAQLKLFADVETSSPIEVTAGTSEAPWFWT